MVAHMRPLVPHVVGIPKDEDLPLEHWVIDGLPRVAGKRERKFFRNREDADKYAIKESRTKSRRDAFIGLRRRLCAASGGK
jgi:hypothetical protein